MRLIDVDAFKADYHMANECKDCKTPIRACEYDRVYTKMDFCSWLGDASTIEQERKTGRWVPVDSFSAYGGDQIMWETRGNPVAFHYCSECREQAYVSEDGSEILSEFCPFCGAYMGRK